MDAGVETQDGEEEQLDDLFTYKEGDEATYFVSEGPGDQELDVRPSGGVAFILEKGEIATQGYESEDVEILETPEERRLTTEPPTEEPATGEAFAVTTAAESTTPLEITLGDMSSSKVDSLTIEATSAEIVATRVTSLMETIPTTTISTGVTIADTSALLGNNCKNLAINFFIYRVFFL